MNSTPFSGLTEKAIRDAWEQKGEGVAYASFAEGMRQGWAMRAALASPKAERYPPLPSPTWEVPDAYTDHQMRAYADATYALRAAPINTQPSRAQIRDVFLRNGFTVKEGQTDLKEYVYDAAYALLAAASCAHCPRCNGSGEDPEGYFDQSHGPDGDTQAGPCRVCGGSGAAPAPTTEQAGAPVAWRHSKTLCLYESEADVELADGDEWAEPLYLHPAPGGEAPAPAVAAAPDARDASRYRWLRRWKGQEHEPPFSVQHEIDGTLWGGDLDAAIDSAMAAQGQEGGAA